MRKFLVDLGWAIAAVVVAFVLWMAAAPARAQDGAQAPRLDLLPPPGRSYCYRAEGFCVTRMDEYLVMRSCTMQAPGVIADLEKRLAEATKEPAKCADVTVTEPSKAPKLPFIPREPVDGGKT